MKILTTALVLILSACSTKSDKKFSNSSTIAPVQIDKSSKGETSEEREYIDSAHFHIVRGKYTSGEKYLEVYENKQTKLDSWKEYYENGQLKEEGTMTNAHHIYIGIWKYYSHKGTLDSLVDYDKKYPISYGSALKIARKHGYKMPEIEITLIEENKQTFWQVTKWKENENKSGQIAQRIVINTNTGKVIKPKDQLLSIY